MWTEIVCRHSRRNHKNHRGAASTDIRSSKPQTRRSLGALPDWAFPSFTHGPPSVVVALEHPVPLVHLKPLHRAALFSTRVIGLLHFQINCICIYSFSVFYHESLVAGGKLFNTGPILRRNAKFGYQRR